MDISEWLVDQYFTDCTVKSSDGKVFKLHRVVLAHHSDVFKAMLTIDMKEAKTNVINLTEKSTTLANLFDLMYTGECEGDYRNFKNLAVVTKKYLLFDLHLECLEMLESLVRASNAVELLIFANENGFEVLQEEAVACIGE